MWNNYKEFFFYSLKFWRSYIVILVPLLALPLLFQDKNELAFKCAYVMVIMATYWMTEAIPLAVTAFIPVVLFPILGIMTTDAVGRVYLKETNMMFMSGIMVALSLEHSMLHKRIALKVLMFVGTGPVRLMLGFMLTTAFFSMWISNTATTAMMVPIVTGVMNELDAEIQDIDEDPKDNTNDLQLMQSHEEIIVIDKKKEKLRLRRVMMYLAVAYSANTGGTATLTGTGTNLVLKGVLKTSFNASPINFASWMMYALPIALTCVIACWIWLQIWFLGFRSIFEHLRRRTPTEHAKVRNSKIKELLQKKYLELGKMNFHEFAVLILFTLLVFLWFFRDPGFIKGWGNYVTTESVYYTPENPDCTEQNCAYTKRIREKETIDDATAGMLIVILLFIIPSKLNFGPFNKLRKDESKQSMEPSKGLLEWKVIHEKMPWGPVLLLGGGFALAKATEVSGFSMLLSDQLSFLQYLDQRLIVVIICFFTCFATEVTSNVATITILLPILRDLSLSLGINPVYLMLPATITCSYAFMLPVATPPNAIVYGASGVMKTSDMIKCGFFVNLICLGINFIYLNTYGIVIFDINNYPSWANVTH